MWLQGCWWLDDYVVEECDDCFNRVPFYANNSGVTINLTVIMGSENAIFTEKDTAYYYSEYTRYKQEIKNNEIMCNYENPYDYHLSENCTNNTSWNVVDNFYENDWNFVKPSLYKPNDIYKPMYFKIEFLNEQKICLVYDGDDKLVNDIRYWENYILVEKATYSHVYYYYITPEHKAMAKEEDCLL
jgi:hypothetical protein